MAQALGKEIRIQGAASNGQTSALGGAQVKPTSLYQPELAEIKDRGLHLHLELEGVPRAAPSLIGETQP